MRQRQLDTEKQLQHLVAQIAVREAAVEAERERAQSLQSHVDRMTQMLAAEKGKESRGSGGDEAPAAGPPAPAAAHAETTTQMEQQVTVQTVRRVYQYTGGQIIQHVPQVCAPCAPMPRLVTLPLPTPQHRPRGPCISACRRCRGCSCSRLLTAPYHNSPQHKPHLGGGGYGRRIWDLQTPQLPWPRDGESQLLLHPPPAPNIATEGVSSVFWSAAY